MQIKITPRTLGGTEFTAQPARLHLGAQNAEGVDRLVFQLPAEWAGCSVTLHIRHSDGTLAAPLVLDAAHSVPVGRSFTGWPAGQWMLAATDGSGYTAYTRPGRYDVYDILPTDGTEEEPSPSVYEQFIAQVSGQADAAVQAAQNSAASEASAARQAQAAADAAERAALNGSRAATSASRAESAALRAESFAPEDGTLLSVNGKGGAVVLDAQDVGALPAPVAPQAGALLHDALRGKRLQLPAAIDVEDARLRALTPDALSALVAGAARQLEHWSLYAMVYTYTHFADTALHMDTLAPFDLWLADYRGKRPARRHGMWQYTSRGRVPGISGPVDLSRTEKDYPALLHRAGLDRTIL